MAGLQVTRKEPVSARDDDSIGLESVTTLLVAGTLPCTSLIAASALPQVTADFYPATAQRPAPISPATCRFQYSHARLFAAAPAGVAAGGFAPGSRSR